MAKIGHTPKNAKQRLKRSGLGIELVRLLASEGRRVFSIDDARGLSSRVDLKDSYLGEALYHLHRTGWIVPLKRGLYAVSSAVPGVSPAHEYEIALSLVQPGAISHWSALHHYGLTEQVPRDVFVLTTQGAAIPRLRGHQDKREKGSYAIGGIVYRFIQVGQERFFGTEQAWVGEARITMTDPERTLLDGLSRPQYCGDFAEVLHAFQAHSDRLNLDRIIKYALRLDGATVKRLGWVLERQGIDAAMLDPLRQVSVKGYRKLDASGPRAGRYHSGWMIQENLPGKIVP